ncbi:tetratricopeptide repeat protein [Streptomyces sp. NPDC056921]|uniref:tetratricopeptide repeat protein n=1 Tax=Streptomyces sp. NPDC056921 TaxID=3345966 RepID=UPI0036409939
MTTTLHPAVERADLLIDLKRYEEARELLARRIAEEPEDIRAWVELARSHLGDEESGAKALEATERALALDAEDIGALLMHARAMRVTGRFPETEGVLREVIRLAPDYWYGYALLADWLWRIRSISSGQANGGQVGREDLMAALGEAELIAQQAIRLGPEAVYAYEVAWRIADMAANRSVADQMDEAILRLDPQHEQALARRTEKAATAPGIKATGAATCTPTRWPPPPAPRRCSAAWTRPPTACCAVSAGWLCSALPLPLRVSTCSRRTGRPSGSCRWVLARGCGTSSPWRSSGPWVPCCGTAACAPVSGSTCTRSSGVGPGPVSSSAKRRGPCSVRC